MGVFWIGVSAGFLLLSHHLTVVEKNEVKQIWIWIFAAFINGIMQELLVRGYIYQLLKAQYISVTEIKPMMKSMLQRIYAAEKTLIRNLSLLKSSLTQEPKL